MQTVSSSDSCSEAIIRVSPVCMYPCKLPACEDSKVPLLCFSFGVQTYIHSMPVYEAPNNNTTNSLNTAGPIVQLDLMRGHAKIQCMEPLETCRMNQTTQYLHNNVKTPCLMNIYMTEGIPCTQYPQQNTRFTSTVWSTSPQHRQKNAWSHGP